MALRISASFKFRPYIPHVLYSSHRPYSRRGELFLRFAFLHGIIRFSLVYKFTLTSPILKNFWISWLIFSFPCLKKLLSSPCWLRKSQILSSFQNFWPKSDFPPLSQTPFSTPAFHLCQRIACNLAACCLLEDPSLYCLSCAMFAVFPSKLNSNTLCSRRPLQITHTKINF